MSSINPYVDKEISQSTSWFDWWISVPVGQIVHFSPETNLNCQKWVRAEVIDTLFGTGLQIVGLVGNWSTKDVSDSKTSEYIYFNKMNKNEIIYRPEFVYKIYEYNPDRWPHQTSPDLLPLLPIT